jgi:hypothetical protein
MLILNRDFKMPEDGFYQIAPLGEFAHACAGVMQVIDQEACVAMAARFAADAAVANFAGLLIDFDHFSMQGGQRSEAAGWIVGLEARAGSGKGQAVSAEGDPHPSPLPSQGEGAGLWAQIRWSDLGEEAVKGGRYRFLSPVWAREDCVELGMDVATGYPRMRPVRLLNAAVTNDPNLRGMRPLSNSSQKPEVRSQKDEKTGTGDAAGVEIRHCDGGACGGNKREIVMKAVIEKLVNHLGLAADAVEAVILEKMAGMPGLTVVADLQNSLTAARTELDALKAAMKGVEGELVNRHLAEFEGVVTEKTKGFWTEQLVANRAGALIALGDLKTVAESGKGEAAGGNPPAGSGQGGSGQTRKPLHNRVTARPVPPGQCGGGGTEGDSKAVKIRNRAQEIVATEKIPFSVAFRRAEKEVAA